MTLSPLQRFILIETVDAVQVRVSRKRFTAYYRKFPDPPHAEDQQNALTKSLERLIDKGMLVGFGRRTPKKWYIEEVRLTPKGRGAAKRLFGTQTALPFTLHTRKK